MRIYGVQNSQNFNGIKLSKHRFNEASDVVDGLKVLGLHCSGYKVYFGNYGNIKKQSLVCDYIRSKYPFLKNEFGVVHFPASKDTYLITNKLSEQKMLDDVKIFDEDAVINMLV